MHRHRLIAFALLAAVAAPASVTHAADDETDPIKAGLVKPGAELKLLADGFRFTEGPAVAPNGDVYFTDIPNNRIHKWDVAHGKLSVFMSDSKGANGLFFADGHNLYACQAGENRVIAIDVATGELRPLAQEYGGKKFNKPNDLWIDPKGGVYFTDPNYGNDPRNQEGEHVYYIGADKKVTRVIDDHQRPNGLVGTTDGKILYVSDRGANKTWRYDVQPDGALTNKKLFCSEGSDGVTLDAKGNLYITPPASAVHVYSPHGELIAKIATPKGPSNVVFGGKHLTTLYITARDSFYAIDMAVKGQTTTKMAP